MVYNFNKQNKKNIFYKHDISEGGPNVQIFTVFKKQGRGSKLNFGKTSLRQSGKVEVITSKLLRLLSSLGYL